MENLSLMLIKNRLAPIPGDVDLDRDVDLADAMRVLQTASGINGASTHFKGDADQDLKLGMAEAIYILQNVGGLTALNE